ncbi:unnamed protein product [Amoebophrya sp. A120]|nr:unnamed protein product [Amoebophrya sp. A120]|eukprot:GSA120T00016037001.1
MDVENQETTIGIGYEQNTGENYLQHAPQTVDITTLEDLVKEIQEGVTTYGRNSTDRFLQQRAEMYRNAEKRRDPLSAIQWTVKEKEKKKQQGDAERARYNQPSQPPPGSSSQPQGQTTGEGTTTKKTTTTTTQQHVPTYGSPGYESYTRLRNYELEMKSDLDLLSRMAIHAGVSSAPPENHAGGAAPAAPAAVQQAKSTSHTGVLVPKKGEEQQGGVEPSASGGTDIANKSAEHLLSQVASALSVMDPSAKGDLLKSISEFSRHWQDDLTLSTSRELSSRNVSRTSQQPPQRRNKRYENNLANEDYINPAASMSPREPVRRTVNSQFRSGSKRGHQDSSPQQVILPTAAHQHDEEQTSPTTAALNGLLDDNLFPATAQNVSSSQKGTSLAGGTPGTLNSNPMVLGPPSATAGSSGRRGGQHDFHNIAASSSMVVTHPGGAGQLQPSASSPSNPGENTTTNNVQSVADLPSDGSTILSLEQNKSTSSNRSLTTLRKIVEQDENAFKATLLDNNGAEDSQKPSSSSSSASESADETGTFSAVKTGSGTAAGGSSSASGQKMISSKKLPSISPAEIKLSEIIQNANITNTNTSSSMVSAMEERPQESTDHVEEFQQMNNTSSSSNKTISQSQSSGAIEDQLVKGLSGAAGGGGDAATMTADKVDDAIVAKLNLSANQQPKITSYKQSPRLASPRDIGTTAAANKGSKSKPVVVLDQNNPKVNELDGLGLSDSEDDEEENLFPADKKPATPRNASFNKNNLMDDSVRTGADSMELLKGVNDPSAGRSSFGQQDEEARAKAGEDYNINYFQPDKSSATISAANPPPDTTPSVHTSNIPSLLQEAREVLLDNQHPDGNNDFGASPMPASSARNNYSKNFYANKGEMNKNSSARSSVATASSKEKQAMQTTTITITGGQKEQVPVLSLDLQEDDGIPDEMDPVVGGGSSGSAGPRGNAVVGATRHAGGATTSSKKGDNFDDILGILGDDMDEGMSDDDISIPSPAMTKQAPGSTVAPSTTAFGATPSDAGENQSQSIAAPFNIVHHGTTVAGPTSTNVSKTPSSTTSSSVPKTAEIRLGTSSISGTGANMRPPFSPTKNKNVTPKIGGTSAGGNFNNPGTTTTLSASSSSSSTTNPVNTSGSSMPKRKQNAPPLGMMIGAGVAGRDLSAGGAPKSTFASSLAGSSNSGRTPVSQRSTPISQRSGSTPGTATAKGGTGGNAAAGSSSAGAASSSTAGAANLFNRGGMSNTSRSTSSLPTGSMMNKYGGAGSKKQAQTTPATSKSSASTTSRFGGNLGGSGFPEDDL